MREPPIILLASNSPRRRELMALGNWTLDICVPQVDEASREGESPEDYVVRLAETKARAAAAEKDKYTYVVAADTAVVDGRALLGKPADADEAKQMLGRLRGHTHRVYTGLAVAGKGGSQLLTDVCVTDVAMRDYSDAEIEAYVGSGDAFDKAGSYAIQHPGFRPVDKPSGCYASVMGLPLCHLTRLLARLDATAATDLPAKCQSHLNYACPVSSAILRGEQVG